MIGSFIIGRKPRSGLICIKICFDITMFIKYCYPKNGLTLRNVAVYLSTSTKYCKKNHFNAV